MLLRSRSRLVPLLALVLILVGLPLLARPAASVRVQDSTPGPLSCEPAPRPAASTPAAGTPAPSAPAPGEPLVITVGYVPVSIFAPLIVALEKGYYA